MQHASRAFEGLGWTPRTMGNRFISILAWRFQTATMFGSSGGEARLTAVPVQRQLASGAWRRRNALAEVGEVGGLKPVHRSVKDPEALVRPGGGERRYAGLANGRRASRTDPPTRSETQRMISSFYK